MIFLSIKSIISLTFRKLFNNPHNSQLTTHNSQLTTHNLRCEGLPVNSYKMNSIVF